jgi:hypothetical protein
MIGTERKTNIPQETVSNDSRSGRVDGSCGMSNG